MATERSPIPPVLASGEILKKGTAVVTTFNLFVCCADTIVAKKNTNTLPKLSFEAVDLIISEFKLVRKYSGFKVLS